MQVISIQSSKKVTQEVVRIWLLSTVFTGMERAEKGRPSEEGNEQVLLEKQCISTVLVWTCF